MSDVMDTPLGLNSGRQWTALPDQDKPLEWCMDASGAFLQGPLDLTCLRGKKVLLNLEEDQLALYTVDQELRAIYLDGGHILDVGNRQGQISPQGRLFFLALNQPLNLRWSHGNPLDLPGFESQHIIGNCQVLVTGPSLFYEHFIKPASLPEMQDLQDITDALDNVVSKALAGYLGTPGHVTTIDPASLQSTLMNLQAETFNEDLLYCGLSCSHLALYTAQPPVEAWSSESYEQERTGQSPRLAHN